MTFHCAILAADRPGATRCTVQCATCAVMNPEPPRTRPRDLDWERKALESAVNLHMPPEALDVLMSHAERRSIELSGEYVPDPMRVQVGRNRLCDVREELADAVNHARWWIEENREHDEMHAVMLALREIGRAYAWVWRAESSGG